MKYAPVIRAAKTLGAVALLVLIAATAQAAPTFDEAMQPILKSYLTIQQSLAADSVDGVSKAAEAIEAAAADLKNAEVEGDNAEQYRELRPKIEDSARKLAASKDLESAREAFRELSMPVAAWVVLAKPSGVVVAFCPMAGGSWVQRAGEIYNPYFGKQMLHCGHIVGEDFKPCPHARDKPGGCREGCGGAGCPHEQQQKKEGAPACCRGATGT